MSQKTAKTVTIKFLNKQNQTVKVVEPLVQAVLQLSSSNLNIAWIYGLSEKSESPFFVQKKKKKKFFDLILHLAH